MYTFFHEQNITTFTSQVISRYSFFVTFVIRFDGILHSYVSVRILEASEHS